MMTASLTLARAMERTWATVDLDALARNAGTLRALVPETTLLMAVVKADAYGHGMIPVARAALATGAGWLGVATPEEAVALRATRLEAPVLVLGPVSDSWMGPLAAARCSVSIVNREGLAAVTRYRDEPPVRIHLKVDTGMTRLGVDLSEVDDVLRAIGASRAVVEGIFTHLACADDPDPAMTRAQLAAFARAVGAARRRYPGILVHAAASAGVLAYPESAFDLVRAGIALYGIAPAPHLRADLRPVMSVTSRVVRVQRVSHGTPVSYGATYRSEEATSIATVPVGYGDGYPRALSNTGVMVIDGYRVRVAGRVCMDYTMLDVGQRRVREGDTVTVFGSGLPADEVARAAGTISYELLCRVGGRVPRIFLRSGQPVELVTAGSQHQMVRSSDAGRRVGG
jgi:alanine racemase